MSRRPAPLSMTEDRDEVKGTPYESLQAGKPPIPITVAPRPSSARLELHPSLRPKSSSPEPAVLNGTPPTARSKLRYDPRRDSAIAVSNPTARNSRATITTDGSSSRSLRKSHSLPRMNGNGSAVSPASKRIRIVNSATLPKASMSSDDAPKIPDASFLGPPTDLPAISFEDLASPDNIQFSKRGSMLIGGKRATDIRESKGAYRQATSMAATVPVRLLSAEEEATSRRVRSMYENGTEEIPASPEPQVTVNSASIEDAIEEEPASADGPEPTRHVSYLSVPSQTSMSQRSSRGSFARQEHELAGGIEDWQDVHGGDVDRYGFISPRPLREHNGSSVSVASAPSPQLHRVSTALQIASDTPRRNTSRLGRSPSQAKSSRFVKDLRSANREAGKRPVSSQSSYRTTASSTSRIRTATNRLPHNRSRRVMDEAGDMLTLPPGLADIAEQEDGGRTTDAAKHKEWEREAKWRKMARVAKRDGHGGGMTFDFDTRDPKLIERTWKGIPDRWRASAWYSFLAASAQRTPGSPTDVELRAAFDELLEQPSPDDGQIDTDVPRTIGSHIMFRTRYRGGQRLLFRVLHCLSLHFPDTGYVQGMAALAATFLCYFDEQTAFVMLVRMWQLRGLERLYSAGFDGLMLALDDFDRRWLRGTPVGNKLTELAIGPTAYGTRWYLTAFNYSIPFPAQLRVWDVFLLLGDLDPTPVPAPSVHLTGGPAAAAAAASVPPQRSLDKQQQPAAGVQSFGSALDVLHATSAALIDATREILLDSDFENAMKVLTSWIPVRDEELLMRVAKAEWRTHRRK